ncbi:polysaccharide deacetylase family protein [Paenibacillus oceani]|uniref:Polysaccharide deacetylase family protein n=1 Tax=Paenibacillus oceani TaxID=2772510 RepID=A0A927C8K6_9BACL|nr:polysaccharide deacetylase family protein [Paenibacillus oceani]MBD2863160.1 polysaccharide deacetylase family protein [Paenibacillus oceani]
MRTISSILTTALVAGTLLSGCSDSAGNGPQGASPDPGQPSQSQQEGGKTPVASDPGEKGETPAAQSTGGNAAPPVTPGDKPAEEPKTVSKPEPPKSGLPAAEQPKPEQPQAEPPKTEPPKEPAKPTAADQKAVSWYYMKKKKGEVPGFPAETKQLKPEQKAVWIGKENTVYLTIDVGGELLDYETLLKSLKDNEVKATFFVTGYNLKNNPDYIKLLLEEGHTVGNHSITHKDFTTLTDDQVKKEVADYEKLYKDITGQEPVKFFRFPYGKYSMHLLTLMSDLGYTSYFWSTAMKDWEPRKNGAEDAFNDVTGNVHDGNIILMHQASKENIEAMDRILKEIKKDGYKFGTLDELQK